MRRTVTYRDVKWRPTAAQPPHRGALAAGLLLLMVLVILSPLMTQSDLPFTGEGNPARQGFYLLAAALVVFGVRPVDSPRRLLAVPLPVVLALAVCWLSLTWAIDPGVAARRLILTTTVIWTIFAGTEHYGFDPTVKLLRIMLVVGLVFNFAAVLLFPATGIHQMGAADEINLAGDWRGIMMHKNFAGALCSITILFFVFSARAIPMALRVGVVAATAVFLWFSHSKTSLGMGLAALVIGYLYVNYSSRYRIFVLTGAVVTALAVPVWYNLEYEQTAAAVSNPFFLTGRGMIWRALTNYANDHMMLGAGYGSFWNINAAGSPIYQYGTGWLLHITSAHNGFLDLAVTIGLPCLCVVILMLVIWPLARLLRNAALIGPRGALLLALFVFCIGHNTTESSLLDRDSLPEVFLMLTIALIWNATPAPERTAAPGARAPASRKGQFYAEA